MVGAGAGAGAGMGMGNMLGYFAIGLVIFGITQMMCDDDDKKALKVENKNVTDATPNISYNLTPPPNITPPSNTTNQTQTCAGLRGEVCNQGEVCPSAFIYSSDSPHCCPVACVGRIYANVSFNTIVDGSVTVEKIPRGNESLYIVWWGTGAEEFDRILGIRSIGHPFRADAVLIGGTTDTYTFNAKDTLQNDLVYRFRVADEGASIRAIEVS